MDVTQHFAAQGVDLVVMAKKQCFEGLPFTFTSCIQETSIVRFRPPRRRVLPIVAPRPVGRAGRGGISYLADGETLTPRKLEATRKELP
jgi:hypothetical protein